MINQKPSFSEKLGFYLSKEENDGNKASRSDWSESS